MTDPAPYLPHGLFSSSDATTPRVMIAPQRYIQGDGVLDETGRYLSLLDARRVGILISRRGQQNEGRRMLESLERAGIAAVVATFQGECSLDEVNLQTETFRKEPANIDCLLAVGGGRCVVASKCIAYRLGVSSGIGPLSACGVKVRVAPPTLEHIFVVNEVVLPRACTCGPVSSARTCRSGAN